MAFSFRMSVLKFIHLCSRMNKQCLQILKLIVGSFQKMLSNSLHVTTIPIRPVMQVQFVIELRRHTYTRYSWPCWGLYVLACVHNSWSSWGLKVRASYHGVQTFLITQVKGKSWKMSIILDLTFIYVNSSDNTDSSIPTMSKMLHSKTSNSPSSWPLTRES